MRPAIVALNRLADPSPSQRDTPYPHGDPLPIQHDMPNPIREGDSPGNRGCSRNVPPVTRSRTVTRRTGWAESGRKPVQNGRSAPTGTSIYVSDGRGGLAPPYFRRVATLRLAQTSTRHISCDTPVKLLDW